MQLAFVFPGQGAQHIGMAADVADAEPAAAARLEEASQAVGFDLAQVIREGPDAQLNRTEITQPALLAASIALHDAWLARGGPRPSIVAGHSLGEYSALAAAGALEFADAVRLVRTRGRLMQEAVPLGAGAMAAVLGLDDAQVADCCAGVDGIAAPANYNAPGQIAIAGTAEAVRQAADACREAGARRIVPLDVSVPSHCALMAPAAQGLAGFLDDVALADPRIPVVQNVSAEAVADAGTLRVNLLRQLTAPVRWSDSVRTIAASGTRQFVECGPGAVLSGLARRIDRSLRCSSIGTLERLDAAIAACLEAQTEST